MAITNKTELTDKTEFMVIHHGTHQLPTYHDTLEEVAVQYNFYAEEYLRHFTIYRANKFSLPLKTLVACYNLDKQLKKKY